MEPTDTLQAGTQPVADAERPVARDPRLKQLTLLVAGLLVVAIVAVLYAGRPILLPLAAALMLSFVLRPATRGLRRVHVPCPLSALLLVGMLGAALGYGIYSLKAPASQWLEEAPRSLHQLQARIETLKQSLDRVQAATSEVARLGQNSASGNEQVVVEGAGLDDQLLAWTRQAALGVWTTLILLFFILGWGDRVYRNLVNSLPRFSEQRRAVLIAQDVETVITSYLATITVINLLLGALVAGALYLLDMPNPVLWGVLAGLNNYVPYLGPAVTAVVLTLAALISYPTLMEALSVPAVFLIITSVEGYIVTPMTVGHRLTINPLLIFLSLMFWFFMWGVVGALLSVPMLVCIKAVLQRVEATQPLARLFD